MKNITLKLKAGMLPNDTSWWTEKDWEEHKQLVANLEKEGRLGEEFERTFSFQGHDEFSNVPSKTFGEAGILIPKGNLHIEDKEIPKITFKYNP